jgi:hypothetical protein
MVHITILPRIIQILARAANGTGHQQPVVKVQWERGLLYFHHGLLAGNCRRMG